jgi:hypothetical protein
MQSNTTQVYFITIIQTVVFTRVLHVSACTWTILRHTNTITLQRKKQYEFKGPMFTVAVFITLNIIYVYNIVNIFLYFIFIVHF